MKRAALLAIAMSVAGTAAAKNDPPPPKLDGAAAAHSIVLCTTTLAELEQRLGAPTRDGLLHSGRVVSWITEWEPLARYLAVLVDKDGVVVDLYWDIPTEIPWVPANQCGDRE